MKRPKAKLMVSTPLTKELNMQAVVKGRTQNYFLHQIITRQDDNDNLTIDGFRKLMFFNLLNDIAKELNIKYLVVYLKNNCVKVRWQDDNELTCYRLVY